MDNGFNRVDADTPDAPLTEVVVRMQGAKKGLIVNSTDLCAKAHRADAQFTTQKRFAYVGNRLLSLVA